MLSITEIGQRAKDASVQLSLLPASEKNDILKACAAGLRNNITQILDANLQDVAAAKARGIKGAFIDRLTLTEARVEEMAKGLADVAKLPDPIGEVLEKRTLPNGLIIEKRRVPMGVIGIIYEARPNVTADAFGICLKAGSATILRGGKEALRTNLATVSIFRNVLSAMGYNENMVQILEDTSHEMAEQMMRLNRYIDLLIPRGGSGLIRTVVEKSTVPVIETGTGNCHIYVDKDADLEMAVRILLNAKVQRPGVCNACESLLVHQDVAKTFIPMATKALQEKHVEVRGDAAFQQQEGVVPATEEDWGTEYADYIISARVVKDEQEAIDLIRRYSTHHSECIVTENAYAAEKFLNEVDSACVYVNASTRFTDGGQFGFGAEIGISTQKLHARGPMGVKEITTTKYVIYGTGQVRP